MRKKIRSDKELQFMLKTADCLDAYYSTSTWLNPHKLGRRSEEVVYEALFLKNDIFFDIDFQPFSFENLEKARNEAIRLLAFLSNQKIQVKYIAFSGSKGFHISCNDPNVYAGNPLERELATISKRKNLVKEIEDLGITIDSKITIDTRRIVRIPGTINSKSGYLCRVLSLDELLDNSAKEIVKRTPKEESASPKPKKFRPNKEDDVRIDVKTNISGTERNILSLEYPSYRSAKKAMLQVNDYGIDLVFLLKKNRRFYIVSPISFDKKRILKISKNLSKADHSRYLKYGHSTFPINSKPLFYRKDETSKTNTYSKAHIGILNKMFSSFFSPKKLCGKENVLMAIGVLE